VELDDLLEVLDDDELLEELLDELEDDVGVVLVELDVVVVIVLV